MKTWTERLCGTEALSDSSEKLSPSYFQLTKPSQTLSDGGSFRPAEHNQNAGMMKLKKNIILPTDYYAIMMFNAEDSAVIYSDVTLPSQDEKSPTENLSIPNDPKNMN